MSASQNLRIDTEALAAGGQRFTDITEVLSRVAGMLENATENARQGFGGGDVGRVLNEQVLPQARQLHEATLGLSTDTGQTAAGLKTSAKGYLSTNDQNNAAVAAVRGGKA